MKKHFLLLAGLLAATMMSADVLIDHTQFFRAEAVNANGTTLERATYSGTSATIMANQWNGSGKENYHVGDDFAVETSDLAYADAENNTYIDNAKGLKIIGTSNMTFSSNGHDAIYSLTSSQATYTGKAYYAAFLLNVESCTSTGGNDIFGFDGNHCANTQRGRIYVKRGEKVDGNAVNKFAVGIGFNGTPVNFSAEFDWGTTVLIVAMYTPNNSSSDPKKETYALYVNPLLESDITENVPVGTREYTFTTQAKDERIKGIKGLTVRKRNNIKYQLAGLRFTDSWAEAVKAAPAASYTLTVPACGWASLYHEKTLEIPNGVTAYYATTKYPTFIELAEVENENDVIPANSGVILSAAAGELTLNYAADQTLEPIADNFFKGTATGETVESMTTYVLAPDQIVDNVPVIAPFRGTTIPAHKMYVPASKIDGPGAAIRMIVPTKDPIITAIEDMKAHNVNKALVNGRIIILRDGKAFDAKGNMLK